jgi:hypothetical protein
VYEWNQKKHMRVFLFSDTDNPEGLLSDFRKCFEGYDIAFETQNNARPDLNNTIQDFFAMQQFDVLIATQSHFSFVAAHAGNFDMIIVPVHSRGSYPNYYIDRVQMISKKSSWFPYDLDITIKD